MSPNSSNGKDPEGKRFDQVINSIVFMFSYFRLLLRNYGN